jgi:hypothetical protein
MLNLLENQPPLNKPVIFGGNVNSTLRSWLQQLGVSDFFHAGVVVRSIDPADIQLSANYIRETYGRATVLLTIGTFAHKTLITAGLDHGALPPTSTKDKKEIEVALHHCRNYLIRSMYYAPKSGPPLSSG